DDKQILAELEGRIPDVLTYHFKDKGQEIWGLSKAGVDEATGELAKQGEVIRELDSSFEIHGKDGLFTATAGRYVISKDGTEVLLDTKKGFKRQPMSYNSGSPNPFWFEQGAIKACRNASMRLIPSAIKQGVIELAKKQGKVQKVEVPAEKKPPKKKPEQDAFGAMLKSLKIEGSIAEQAAVYVAEMADISGKSIQDIEARAASNPKGFEEQFGAWLDEKNAAPEG
ncbi:MAG: hypothetical protein ACWGQW_23340, partial [bacterium]